MLNQLISTNLISNGNQTWLDTRNNVSQDVSLFIVLCKPRYIESSCIVIVSSAQERKHRSNFLKNLRRQYISVPSGGEAVVNEGGNKRRQITTRARRRCGYWHVSIVRPIRPRSLPFSPVLLHGSRVPTVYE